MGCSVHLDTMPYSFGKVASDLLYAQLHQGAWLPSHTDRARRRPTKGFDYPVTQTRLDIAYQSLSVPSHTYTAGHTKAFDYPVTQTRLDIPRPLITQSHRHGWTYQAFDYPVTQTRLDIPRPLITQSHRHGWTYQGLWLPSHTDTAGHTKAFDYPVMAIFEEGQREVHDPMLTL